jgi:hypothetical protein
MKTFIIRIKSRVDNKTYVLRVEGNSKYNAMGKADRVFVSKHPDRLPADFIN